MLFHAGAVWRLNELGFLPRLERVSSVSGGSITAGVLGLGWSRLAFDAAGVAQRFEAEVITPLRRLADRTIDVWAVFFSWLGFGIIPAYRRHLFGNATLQDLPDRPRFVINANSVQSGALWRFSKPYVWDYRIGEIPRSTIPLAVAVGASSAFPPVLSPVVLKLKESWFAPNTGLDLQRPPYTRRAVLTDGGVYDNLGLETAWKRYETILVSDGGGKIQPQPAPAINWFGHLYRVINLIDSQVGSLRKRQLIDSFKQNAREGTYWGIRTDIADYHLPDPLPCPEAQTSKLASVATRLKRLEQETQERLINWGYAVCDAAVRRHVEPGAARPGDFPYPASGVG